MHQQAPALMPHSNGVPQRAQVMRRSGSPGPVGVMVIVALLGVIVSEINHGRVMH
jgi:hypothetical protein